MFALLISAEWQSLASWVYLNTCLRIASVLTVIACVLKQESHIAANVPTSSLVNIISKSTHNRTGFWAGRGKSCALA